MYGIMTVFGIDSHARTTTICALSVETGEVETRTFPGNPYGEMREWMASFPAPAAGFYEAGATGFEPARRLAVAGSVRCVPIAPSKMPTCDDARTKKNDREDAERLARYAAAELLREVWVPGAEAEGLRDLFHAIEDMADQLERARRRVCALLLKHGLVWDGRTPSGRPRKKFTRAWWAWAEAAELPSEGSRAALSALLDSLRSAERQHAALLAEAAKVAAASALAPAIDAVQHLKGVGFKAALGFCAQVGDFSRFGGSGRRVTRYLGLAPRESSSAEARRLGGVSKGGCRDVRRLLAEAGWAVARSRPSARKDGPAGVPDAIAAECRRLNMRLRARRDALLASGKHPCAANVATAAELARFMYFVGAEAMAAAAA